MMKSVCVGVTVCLAVKINACIQYLHFTTVVFCCNCNLGSDTFRMSFTEIAM